MEHNKLQKKLFSINRQTAAGNCSGFALVYSLFLVTLVSAIIASSILGMQRHQRLVARDIDKIQVRQFAEAAIRQSMRLFNDYQRLTHDYPPEVGDEVVAPPVYGSSGTVTLNNCNPPSSCPTFESYIEGAWQTEMRNYFQGSLIQNPALKNLNLDVEIRVLPCDAAVETCDNSVDERTGTQKPRHKDYVIDVFVENSLTHAAIKLQQELTMTNGKLFDFGVFFDGDLEVGSAPDFTVQGPIFTNSNAYLMSDNTLTLKGAKGSISDGDYILRAHGRIFTYFKRALGKNPHLDKPFAQYYPDYWKRWDKSEAYDAKVNGRPYFYFMRNEVVPNFIDNPSEERVRLSTQIRLLMPEKTVGSNTRREFEKYMELPPFLRNHVYWYWQIENSYFESGQYYTVNGNYSGCRDSFKNDRGQAYYDCRYGNKDRLFTVTPAYNWSVVLDSEWSPEKPISTLPVKNHNWTTAALSYKSVSDEYAVIDLMKDSDTAYDPSHVQKIEINLGDPDADYSEPNVKRKIIEPVESTDSSGLRDAKLYSKAQIKFLCNAGASAGDCSSMHVESTIALSGASDEEKFDALAKIVSFYDARLGGVFNALEIDVSGITAQTQGLSTGVVVYAETAGHGSGSLSQVRLVILKNATKLPQKGLTIVSNGRVWIKGNYNIFEYGEGADCTAERFDAGECIVPPAALFVDSVGIFSGELGDDYLSDNFKSNQVDEDIMVNTAIVSGMLPSQLRKWIKDDCDGLDLNKCTPDVKDFPEAQTAWYSRRGENYFPAGAPVADCPDGLKADGKPVEPNNCVLYRDMQSGFFFLRRGVAVPRIMSLINKHIQKQKDFQAQYPFFEYLEQDGVASLPAISAELQSFLNEEDWNLNPEKMKEALDALKPYERVFRRPVVRVSGGRTFVLTGIDEFPANTTALQKQIRHRWPYAPSYWHDNKTDLSDPKNMKWVDISEVVAMDGDASLEGKKEMLQELLVAAGGANREVIPVEYKIGFPFTIEPMSYYYDATMQCPANDENTIAVLGYRSELDRTEEWAKNYYPNIWHGFNTTRLPGSCKYRPVGPIAGVNFFVIYPHSMWSDLEQGSFGISEVSSKVCQPQVCTTQMSETGRPIQTCTPTPQVCNVTVTRSADLQGGIDYIPNLTSWWHGRYIPMYQPKYSGGLENLINFQERWSGRDVQGSVTDQRKIRFLGTLTVPYDSEELIKADGTPAYFETSYYSEPQRVFDYNEDFVRNPPPAAPSTFRVNPKKIREVKR